MSQASSREIMLWIDCETEQRYLKWMGKCDNCELNGQPVALSEEHRISPGDDLEIFSNTYSTRLRFFIDEKSSAECAAFVQRFFQRRPVQSVTQPPQEPPTAHAREPAAPPAAPPLPSREGLVEKLSKSAARKPAAAPPPPPPLPSREGLDEKWSKQPAREPAAPAAAPSLPFWEGLAGTFSKQHAGQPAAAPPPPPLPSREVLAETFAKQHVRQPAAAPPPPPPMPSRDDVAGKRATAPPPAPPLPRASHQTQQISNSSVPDPGDFLHQLAMAVCQQKARLQQLPVTLGAASQPAGTAKAGGPPSAQMLQHAIASLRRVSDAPAPPDDTDVTPSHNLVCADTRPSDPFAPKLSTSTTRSSFEPTIYLGDLGAQRMSSMHKRDSRSMRPSFAPVQECEELEDFARDATASVSMSPMFSSGEGVAAFDSIHAKNMADVAVQPGVQPTSASVRMSQSMNALPSPAVGVRRSPMCNTHPAPVEPPTAADAAERDTPAVSQPSVPELSQQYLQEQTISLSHGIHAAVGAKSPRATAITPQQSVVASASRSISFAPPGVTPEVTAHVLTEAPMSQGSVSVGAPNPGITPKVVPRTAAASGILELHAASALGQHSARAESAAQVFHKSDTDPDDSDALALKLQYHVSQAQHIISRLHTLHPDGCAEVEQAVAGLFSQVQQRKGLSRKGPAADGLQGQVPEISMAASAMTVQQELKQGLGRGKDLMMVRRSAPQASTVSRLSAPVRSRSFSRSQGSWKVQGPDVTVPASDPESLVGRRVWFHYNKHGWAPGIVTEYLAPTCGGDGSHVVTFNADTGMEFQEQIHLMCPTEQVSWQDPGQKVLCQAVNTNGQQTVSRSQVQPRCSELTVGAAMNAAATPSAVGPWNENMMQAPSTACSLAPDFNIPPCEDSKSTPLLPPAGPVWATPSAFTDGYAAGQGGTENMGESMSRRSPIITGIQPSASVPQGSTRAATPTTMPPQLTPITSRSNAGTAYTGGDQVPESWWREIHSGNVTRCTDMLTSMLRSPAAAQLPDTLHLPLESAIASARASPSLALNLIPEIENPSAHIPAATEVDSGAGQDNDAAMKYSGRFEGFPAENPDQQPSPMEGLQASGGLDNAARSSSRYTMELNSYLGTEFLEAEPLSQDTGVDGNFTQPLSPSIYSVVAAADVPKKTGNSGVQNAAGGFEWLMSETDAAAPLSTNGVVPTIGRLSLPELTAPAENAGAPASSEKHGPMGQPTIAAQESPGPGTSPIISTLAGAAANTRVLTPGVAAAASSGLHTHTPAVPAASHGNSHVSMGLAEPSGAAQQNLQIDAPQSARSPSAHHSVHSERDGSRTVEGPPQAQTPTNAVNTVQGQARVSFTTASSVRDLRKTEAAAWGIVSRPGSPLSAHGIPATSPTKQPIHSPCVVDPEQEPQRSLAKQSISVCDVAMSVAAATDAAAPSPHIAMSVAARTDAAVPSPHIAMSVAAPTDAAAPSPHIAMSVAAPTDAAAPSPHIAMSAAAPTDAAAPSPHIAMSAAAPTDAAAPSPHIAMSVAAPADAAVPSPHVAMSAATPADAVVASPHIAMSAAAPTDAAAPSPHAAMSAATPADAMVASPHSTSPLAASQSALQASGPAHERVAFVGASVNAESPPAAQLVSAPASPTLQPPAHSLPASPADAADDLQVAAVAALSGAAGTPKWRESVKAGVPKSPLARAGLVSGALSPRGSLDAVVNVNGANVETPVAFAAAAESIAGNSTIHIAAQFSRGEHAAGDVRSAAPLAGVLAGQPQSAISVAGSSHSPAAAHVPGGNHLLMPLASSDMRSPGLVVTVPVESDPVQPDAEQAGAGIENETVTAAFGSPTADTGTVPAPGTDHVIDIGQALAQDMPQSTPEDYALPAEFIERRVTPVVSAWRSTDHVTSPSPSPSKVQPSPSAGGLPQDTAPVGTPLQQAAFASDVRVADMPPNTGLRDAATPNVTPMSAHPSAAPQACLPVNFTDVVDAIQYAGMCDQSSAGCGAPRSPLSPSIAAVVRASSSPGAVPPSLAPLPAEEVVKDAGSAGSPTSNAAAENADPPAPAEESLLPAEGDRELPATAEDARSALAAAKAASEVDGPARRTRRRTSICSAPAAAAIAPAPAAAIAAAPLAPSCSAPDISNISVQDARAALSVAKHASSQDGSALRTRKRLSMSVSADVDSVRQAQEARMTQRVEAEHEQEEDVEGSPTDNVHDSQEDDKSIQDQHVSAHASDEEDAAPQRPRTRQRRASIAVHQAPAETGKPRTRRQRDNTTSHAAETSDAEGVHSEAEEPNGRSLRSRARRGAAPVLPAQNHQLSTGEPTASDTTKMLRGTSKRGRAARAAASPEASPEDGNVSDSEGPMTRRRRAKVGTVAAESEEITASAGDMCAPRRKRARRRAKAGPTGNEEESLSTGVVPEMSESMAGGDENEGTCGANGATSKLLALHPEKETEGIRVDSFQPKLSAVPEEDVATIKRGKPGRRKKPYQPIPGMQQALATLNENQPVRRSRRTCSQTTG